MRARTWLLAVALATLLPAAAQATDGSGAFSIRPWTGATLSVSQDDTRMALGLSFLKNAFRADFEGGVPLDASAGTAGALGKGFAGTLFLGYDSRWADLGLPEGGVSIEPTKERCERAGLAWGSPEEGQLPCTGGNLYTATQGAVRSPFLVPIHAWALGLTLGGRFNRLTAFPDAQTTTRRTYDDYGIEVGVRATWAPLQSLLLAVDGGWNGSRAVTVVDGQACATLADGTSDCQPGSVLETSADLAHRGYARLAASWIIPQELQDLVPGLELRAGVEDLGGDERLESRLLVFFAPVKSPLAISFGVGVALSTALVASPGYEPGDTLAFTPFAMTAGTLGSLVPGS